MGGELGDVGIESGELFLEGEGLGVGLFFGVAGGFGGGEWAEVAAEALEGEVAAAEFDGVGVADAVALPTGDGGAGEDFELGIGLGAGGGAGDEVVEVFGEERGGAVAEDEVVEGTAEAAAAGGGSSDAEADEAGAVAGVGEAGGLPLLSGRGPGPGAGLVLVGGEDAAVGAEDVDLEAVCGGGRLRGVGPDAGGGLKSYSVNTVLIISR